MKYKYIGALHKPPNLSLFQMKNTEKPCLVTSFPIDQEKNRWPLINMPSQEYGHSLSQKDSSLPNKFLCHW